MMFSVAESSQEFAELKWWVTKLGWWTTILEMVEYYPGSGILPFWAMGMVVDYS